MEHLSQVAITQTRSKQCELLWSTWCRAAWLALCYQQWSAYVLFNFTLPVTFCPPSLQTADVSPRSSPLRDVSRGGTSATQRQKFHTDDAKSVQNPVRSANWSTEQFHCFSHCLRLTDKRQKAAKVKCKRDESLTKQPIFVEYSLLSKKHLSFA